MRLPIFWTRDRDRFGGLETTGPETRGTEEALRAALAEPAAPGEDESYRRLMGVIADDMRLRQPAPAQRNWGWIPALSASASVAILLVVAYMAGVDRGVEIGQRFHPSQVVAEAPKDDTVVRRDKYTSPPVVEPPTAPEKPARPHMAVKEVPPPTPMNYLGSILFEGLSDDQRDALRLYTDQAKSGDWTAAGKTLEGLADMDPGSDLAIRALDEAARIAQDRLNDRPEALRLYQRERDICQKQLETATLADRRGSLRRQIEEAQRAMDTLGLDVPTEAPAAPAPDENR